MSPTSLETTQRELEAGLAELPIIDIHTHLVGGRLAARGLHDILLITWSSAIYTGRAAPAARG